MRTPEYYRDEMRKAAAKKEKAYKTMLRLAARCKELDALMRRLHKATLKAKKFQKEVANGQSFSKVL